MERPQDFGTLAKVFDEIRKETEAEASMHFNSAAKFYETCTKFTEFRDK